jgi:hypothetical protein
LKCYGLPGKFYNLGKSYLYGRYKNVILSHNNGIESTSKEVNKGVPQGLILGPSYGIIFWGRASKVTKLFTLQKLIIRIITDKRPRDSCREAFRKMEILTLHSQYLYSLIIFTVENNHQFTFNKDTHLHKLDTTQIYTYQ